jgi:hypothetical protein
MRHKVLIKLFCVLFTTFGCGQEQPKNTELPVIDIVESIEESEETTMLLSEIADDITFIPLETTDECLIAGGSSIHLHKDYFVIMDNTPQVFLFDRTGKFIRKTGNKGQGPGEYISAGLPVIVKDELFYYDISGKTLCYDLHTGKCLRTKKHDYNGNPLTMWCSNDSVLVYYFPYLASGDPKEFAHIHTLSLDFEITNKLWYEELQPEMKPGDKTYTINTKDIPILYSTDGNTYIYPKLEQGTVFCIDGNLEKTPAYQIYMGKYYFEGNEYKKSYSINGIADTDRFVFLSGTLYPDYHSGSILYDKTTGKSKRISIIINDIDKSFQAFWPVSNNVVSRNILCTAVYPFVLKEQMSDPYYKDIKVKNREKHQAIKEYLDSAKEDDNPVVVLITLKEK